jgi:hypothetical protein
MFCSRTKIKSRKEERNMLKRISQWIADRTVGHNRVLQERANDVREIARRLRLTIFPALLIDGT